MDSFMVKGGKRTSVCVEICAAVYIKPLSAPDEGRKGCVYIKKYFTITMVGKENGIERGSVGRRKRVWCV